MFSTGIATKIYLVPGPTDMRKGFDGLYGLVQEKVNIDPLTGHLFLFCNKPRTRLKVLYWDGSGLWVCSKRLEKGRFGWPAQATEKSMTISAEELTLLVGGIDLKQTRKRRWWRVDGTEAKAA